MPDQRYRRRSARILLLDGAGRVLLFPVLINSKEPERGYCWITPGGGMDPGEDVADAAARELYEETGLRVTPDELGPVVATSQGHVTFDWATGLFRDDYFTYRVESHEVAPTALEEYEADLTDGHRWCTVAELAALTEPVYPFGLIPLLERLLAGERPAEPVQLPWHH